MTSSEIVRLPFSAQAVSAWQPGHSRHTNWPVVYVLDEGIRSDRQSGLVDVYVGESRNAAGRFKQHLSNPDKQHLRAVRVIVDDTFNKSVCLDLESYLIRMFDGDGSVRVLNRNDGITDADYFDRARYQETFAEIFEQLRAEGLFTRTAADIENSDLFKLSPFKALLPAQAAAVSDIVEGLSEDLRSDTQSTLVVHGEPGTGKTVVATYLLKLLADIGSDLRIEDLDSDSIFSEFFLPGHREAFEDLRIGLVIPQQSLRKSVKRAFKKIPRLSADMVLNPFDVGKADGMFDLLLVDETHRLNQRANQASAMQNTMFGEINERLFGWDDPTKTQLDWIVAKSRHRVLLIDAAQTVRPADLPASTLNELVSGGTSNRQYRLESQLRVRAGDQYVAYVRRLVGAERAPDDAEPAPMTFGDYDFRMFDDFVEMRDEIVGLDGEHGLARLIAGYAWPWKSKKDRTAVDIEIAGLEYQWNQTDVDWIASPNSLNEIGSIHTVQGYDLNYAGVIIGPDLKYDVATSQLRFDRSAYSDTRGMQNSPKFGVFSDDEDLLKFVGNIYAVLLTRGIRGTFVYVVDDALREHLRQYIPQSAERHGTH